MGIKESDTGLVAPSQWDLVSDKQMMQEEQPLQVWFLAVAELEFSIPITFHFLTINGFGN